MNTTPDIYVHCYCGINMAGPLQLFEKCLLGIQDAD